MRLLGDDVRPREIMTRQAFENAVASLAATGGSTNAVLHLLAMAHAAEVPLTLDDFDTISSKTPIVADLKPGGRFVANDLFDAGGVALVAKELLKRNLLNDDSRNVDGRTLAAIAEAAHPAPGQQVIASIDSPVKASGGIGILRGNLAPDGCVAKLSGHERLQFRGPAKVFESEEECFAAVQAQPIEAGGFIVIRYEGPAGGPGMREMLDVTAAIVEAWTKIRCTQLRVIAGHAK